jgi:hypothetical protein
MKRRQRWFIATPAVVICALIAGLAIAGVVSGGGRPGGATLPPAKATFLAKAREVPTQYLNVTPEPRNRNTPLRPRPPLPAPSGIIDDSQVPFTGYAIRNQWAGIIANERVMVYAGSPATSGTQDPAQGLIVVETTSLDGYTVTKHGGIYRTPHKDGSLRILSVQGDVLTLRSLDGKTFTFDIGTRTFTDVTAPGFVPLAPTATATPGEPFISVHEPSLVNGLVQVPIDTTGTPFPSYSGFNIHLRWDPALFHYSASSSVGSVIPSPFCATSADDDGGGVIYGCTATGTASTSTAGLLATISLQPIGSGCSGLHLFTMTFDGGDTSTGTYLIDAGTNTPDHLGGIAYTNDGGATTDGHDC